MASHLLPKHIPLELKAHHPRVSRRRHGPPTATATSSSTSHRVVAGATLMLILPRLERAPALVVCRMPLLQSAPQIHLDRRIARRDRYASPARGAGGGSASSLVAAAAAAVLASGRLHGRIEARLAERVPARRRHGLEKEGEADRAVVVRIDLVAARLAAAGLREIHLRTVGAILVLRSGRVLVA